MSLTIEEKRTALHAIDISGMVDECRILVLDHLESWGEQQKIARLLDSASTLLSSGAMNRISDDTQPAGPDARATED